VTIFLSYSIVNNNNNFFGEKKMSEKTDEQIVEALKSLGYIPVKDKGYFTEGVDAQQVLFYNPKTKLGLQVWIASPGDQDVFDEYYMQEVDGQFGTNVIESQ
jgi:hypothetical protein